MAAKEIAILIIFCIFLLPFAIEIITWSYHISTNSVETNTHEATELVVKAAIPWWINIFQWLSTLGSVGAFLIVGFIFFLNWIGEI